MFGIGLPELTINLVIALVVFGARKLPNIGTGIGKRLTKKAIVLAIFTANCQFLRAKRNI